MPIAQNSLNEEIGKILNGMGYAVTYLDKQGNKSVDVGTSSFVIAEKGGKQIQFSMPDDETQEHPTINAYFVQKDDLNELAGIKDRIKAIAQMYGVSIVLKNGQINTQATVAESMYGHSRKSSYQRTVPKTRIVVRHDGEIDPDKKGARSRRIASIFIDTPEGERLKLSHNVLAGARAAARHIHNGGKLDDEIGKKINELSCTVADCHKKAFGKIEEDGSEGEPEDRDVIRQKLIDARGQLKRLSGSRSYHNEIKNLSTEDKHMEELKKPVINEEGDDGVKFGLDDLVRILTYLSKGSELKPNDVLKQAQSLLARSVKLLPAGSESKDLGAENFSPNGGRIFSYIDGHLPFADSVLSSILFRIANAFEQFESKLPELNFDVIYNTVEKANVPGLNKVEKAFALIMLKYFRKDIESALNAIKGEEPVHEEISELAEWSLNIAGGLLNEVAAPGQEEWVKKNKSKFKKEYGKKKGEEVLYATSWKRSKNNESVTENSEDPRFYEKIENLDKMSLKQAIEAYATYGGSSDIEDDDARKILAFIENKWGPKAAKAAEKRGEVMYWGRKHVTGKESGQDSKYFNNLFLGNHSVYTNPKYNSSPKKRLIAMKNNAKELADHIRNMKKPNLPESTETVNEETLDESKSDFAHVGWHGSTQVEKSKNHYRISHMGNMGDTEDDVKRGVDKILGKGSFAKLKKHGKYAKDKHNTHSSPDYSYIMHSPISSLNEETVTEGPINELSVEKLMAYRDKAKVAQQTNSGMSKLQKHKANKHNAWIADADEKIFNKTGKYNPGIADRIRAKTIDTLDLAKRKLEPKIPTKKEYYGVKEAIKAPTPKPLKGHDYHSRPTDALQWINQTSRDIANKTKDPYTKKVNQQQADDSDTILDYRSKGGKQFDASYDGYQKRNPKEFGESIETVNELSRKTLGSYVKNAADDLSHDSFMAGDMSVRKDPRSLSHDKKAFKRQKGIEKAVDKMTAESTPSMRDLYSIVSESDINRSGSMDWASLRKEYKRNESDNCHTENVLLLASNFGTPEEEQEVEQALRYRDTRGGYNLSDKKGMNLYRRMQEIHNEYYPLLFPKKGK